MNKRRWKGNERRQEDKWLQKRKWKRVNERESMSENKRALQKYYKAANILHTKGGEGVHVGIYGGVMIELYVRMAEWGQYHAKSNITENEVIRNDG